MAGKISDSSEGRGAGTIDGARSPDGKVVVWVAMGGEELTVVWGPQEATDLRGGKLREDILVTFNLLNVAYLVVNTRRPK